MQPLNLPSRLKTLKSLFYKIKKNLILVPPTFLMGRSKWKSCKPTFKKLKLVKKIFINLTKISLLKRSRWVSTMSKGPRNRGLKSTPSLLTNMWLSVASRCLLQSTIEWRLLSRMNFALKISVVSSLIMWPLISKQCCNEWLNYFDILCYHFGF